MGEESFRGIRRLPPYGVALAAVALVGIVLVAHRHPSAAVAGWLAAGVRVSEEPTSAEYIYVLAGDPRFRFRRAADLYLAGFAPRLLVPEPSAASKNSPAAEEWFLSNARVRDMGVPSSALLVIPFEGGVKSTRDEGCALRAYLSPHPAATVLVVTNEYHSRRARWTVRTKLRGLDTQVRLVAAPNTAAHRQLPARLFLSEYLKLGASVLAETVAPGC